MQLSLEIPPPAKKQIQHIISPSAYDTELGRNLANKKHAIDLKKTACREYCNALLTRNGDPGAKRGLMQFIHWLMNGSN